MPWFSLNLSGYSVILTDPQWLYVVPPDPQWLSPPLHLCLYVRTSEPPRVQGVQARAPPPAPPHWGRGAGRDQPRRQGGGAGGQAGRRRGARDGCSIAAVVAREEGPNLQWVA